MKRHLLAAAFLLLSNQAMAWSKQGHQLVGELAQAGLTPAAQAAVEDLLRDEPVPTLAGVSTWADEIRAESRSAGHALGERSSRWHYVNIPRQAACDYVPARDCPDGKCVIAAIAAQRAILADPAQPRQARIEALKFLVHFVGDAHQPMHAGHPHDRGGNEYQLQYRGKASSRNEGTQLHGVWDYWLLQSARLDNAAYVRKLQALPLPADLGLAGEHPGRDWTLESCRLIASQSLYPRGHKIGDAYLDRFRPLAEARVRLAGARLATLLNEALAPR